MSERFRVWFIFEITCYSLPVVLAATIATMVIPSNAPIHVLLFLAVFFISCCGSIYAVVKLMLCVFHNRTIKTPKLIALLIASWLIIWLFAGALSLKEASVYLAIGFILPVLVVLHLGYLARSSFNINT
jgi:hypothetical protein